MNRRGDAASSARGTLPAIERSQRDGEAIVASYGSTLERMEEVVNLKKKLGPGNARRTKIGDISGVGIRLTEAQLGAVAGGTTYPASIHVPGTPDTCTDPQMN